MRTGSLRCALALCVAALARPSVAVEKGYGEAWSAMGSKIRASDSGDTAVFFASAFAVVVAIVVLARLYNRRQVRIAATARAPAAGDPSQGFRKQAVALGFRAGELRTLRQIAGRLAPRSPGTLLANRSGRENLVNDLGKRIRRRQRELDLLNSMLGKLEVAGEDHYHARDTIRVEANIPIWFVQKLQADDPAEGGDEGLVNMEPVSGRLVDLSEGGAAVAVDLPLSPGEMIEFWSADTQIWIPPLSAGVVNIDEAVDETGPVAHVHFLDPPLADIRRAMQDIQLFSREEDGAGDAGDGGELPIADDGEAGDPSPPAAPLGGPA